MRIVMEQAGFEYGTPSARPVRRRSEETPCRRVIRQEGEMSDRLKSEAAVRAAFWRENPGAVRRWGKRQNEQPTDTRCAFVNWVDQQARAGRVSERLAARVTL